MPKKKIVIEADEEIYAEVLAALRMWVEDFYGVEDAGKVEVMEEEESA